MNKLKNSFWFSFVELIVVISIISILWAVWYSTNQTFKNKSDNARVTADIETINTSLSQYLTETNMLPLPKGNNKFFKVDTTYSHWLDDSPYAVSWFISEWIIAKKYMNYTPIDPRTNNYYAYSRTLAASNVMQYELWWVNYENWEFVSVVRWNYTWENWPYSIIKEYNWNDFVFDKSKQHFPYNPELNILVAKVEDFTGVVRIISEELWTISDSLSILEHTLTAWDKIIVEAWSNANIVFSDGSQSMLWSNTENTELEIAKMTYKEDNNLFSDIKLVLNIWSIFTQASKMDSNSNFEVYTSDTVAAVRWTVFWVNSDWRTSNSNIVVQQWSVKVDEILVDDSSNLSELINSNTLDIKPLNLNWVVDNGHITVAYWDSPKWLEKTSSSTISSTWILTKIDDTVKSRIIDNIWVINNSDQVNVLSVQQDWISKKIELWLSRKLQKRGSLLFINNGEKRFILRNDWSWQDTNFLTLTWWTLFRTKSTTDISEDNTDISLREDLDTSTDNSRRLSSLTTASFNSIISWKEKISIRFCRQTIDMWLRCNTAKELNLNLYFDKADLIDDTTTLKDQLKLVSEKPLLFDASNFTWVNENLFKPWLLASVYNNGVSDYDHVLWNIFSRFIYNKIDFDLGLEFFTDLVWKTLKADYIAIHYKWFFKATKSTHNFRLWWDDWLTLTFNWVNYWNFPYCINWNCSFWLPAWWVHAAWDDIESAGAFVSISWLVPWEYYPIDIRFYERTWYASFRFYDADTNTIIDENNFFHMDECLTILPQWTDWSIFNLDYCRDLKSQKFKKTWNNYSEVLITNESWKCLDVFQWTDLNRRLISYPCKYNWDTNQLFKYENDKIKVKTTSWLPTYCLSLVWNILKTTSCTDATEWVFDWDYVKLKY